MNYDTPSSVRGEGIKGTLSVTATYNGQAVTGTDLLMGQGRNLSITTAYTNWNYIESEEWYDENGTRLATGGSYTYTLKDDQEHQLIFRLTNQSGVVIEKTFHIIPNENELTSSLPDPDCEDPSLWTTNVDGFQRGTAVIDGFSQPFIERKREASEGGLLCWGQERFDISQTVRGLKLGKYEQGASVIATQQGKNGEAAKNYVKDVYLYADGAHTAVSSLDGVPGYFVVDFYVGDDGQVTFGAKNMTDQNYGYYGKGMKLFAIDNFSFIYKGPDVLASVLSDMREQVAEVKKDEVTSGLYETLKALDRKADDVNTAVLYQRALGEVRELQVHYKEYMSVYHIYKEYVETNNVDDGNLKTALAAFEAAGSPEEFFQAFDCLCKAWKEYHPRAEKTMDVTYWLPDGGALTPSEDAGMYDYFTRWMTDVEEGNYRILAIDGSDAARGDAVVRI
ncbi:MAG: hypothetical protein LUC45_03910 [Paraprevotella sp.]|nr:hypothetical protein [Paraprevotella sp.]